MTKKTYLFAGFPFRMEMNYEYTVRFCSDYEVSEEEAEAMEEPVFCVRATDEEIQAEIDGGLEYGNYTVKQTAENVALYRKICDEMADRQTALFHCSAIEVDGRAYLFGAPSGTGKSTHVRLWKERFGERAVVINDDKPLVRFQEDAIFVWGTPWCGKHGINTNKKSPVKGICFLEQGKENHIARLNPIDSYIRILRQIYFPKDEKKRTEVFRMAKRLAEQVPAYLLTCDISQEAVSVSYGALSQD